MNRRGNNRAGPQTRNQPQPNGASNYQPQQETPAPQSNNDTPMDSNDDTEAGGIGAKMRKIFANRKNMSSADRKRLEKERKARQLRRLRKLLTPKNAVVALHELQGPGMSEFTINTNGQETTAEIVVNNVRYEATAPNKHLAKARASEKALRDLVIAQMTKARQNAEKQTNNGTDNENEDVEMNDVSDNDDVPMLHLASYALYKLFNEWQSEGFEIPAIKPTKAAAKVNEAGTHPLAPKVAKTKADLPEDATTRHPTALLAFMRPQIPYEDLGSNNNPDPAKREFSVGVTVDGQRFIDPKLCKLYRKILTPKDAQTVLQQWPDAPQFKVTLDRGGPVHESSGTAIVNNVRYYAVAVSRSIVKEQIAERVLRDACLAKIRHVMQELFPDTDTPMQMSVEAEEIFSHAQFPLIPLVSFALHKLHQNWSDVGLEIPQIKPAKLLPFPPKLVPKPPKNVRQIYDLPKDVNSYHPASLVTYMRPQASFVELPEEEYNDELYHAILLVDKLQFFGAGTSKKLARRNAAVKACRELWEVEFDQTIT